ncbi:PfaD family polyunsaturated fatty acid/polyketide biosynthesis protein [Ramlibacter sp. AW1]|uniref:PfaD family polyunsaturated fatty acid/polyketide biosynthesis protein n=1 Tax=Ramlibacter aurantiacus TaxID=2801330 RepID=A0A936ZKY8_9BURK|nr:PfaD family polyunsaturated fatty acid/polyketide biosynthesis protein [Ramlibacter aurantiacus]MBL0423234.1 PfaD family polyunsaturated fatty acid/polyketide biosynthesis protein [Ramlibacter aurantiacus]
MTTHTLAERPAEAAIPPAFTEEEVAGVIQRAHDPISVVRDTATGRIGLLAGDTDVRLPAGLERLWNLPAAAPQRLGDQGFLRAHGVQYPYIAGEMATGIATAEMVIAMARGGMLGFFGAGGLPLHAVERGLDQMATQLSGPRLPWGVNLIHNLQDPGAEDAVVDLLLRHQVHRVCASAYLQLTPAVVRYACKGLHMGADGCIVQPNQLMAKLSRPEIASRFASPAPAGVLASLVERGQLTAREAELAAHIPLAADITVEADSGGHTDNRPLVAQFPTIAHAVREVQVRHGYASAIRIGAAGGLGTPQSLAAAFSLGAAYVVTGSVNQAALESGLSPAGRALLAQASIEDVAMAPAADMFELGVKVQVLKRGTMFSVRGHRLWEVYRKYPSIDAIPVPEREKLESELFRAPLDEIWRQTQAFFAERNPAEVERASRDPKHLMALVFRWYLGQASRWATQGVPDRVLDYQIWCGPAMGAFNAWTKGSFLAEPGRRTVVQIARNLLLGAAVITRAQQLRSLGVPVPAAAFDFRPRPLD